MRQGAGELRPVSEGCDGRSNRHEVKVVELQHVLKESRS